MEANTPSRSGYTPTIDEDYYDRAYYRDTARCVVPQCHKFRRDYRHLKFMVIPDVLKATWCQKLKIDCPKRKLYICEDHINIQRDCVITKGGRVKIKPTARLYLSKLYEEIPGSSHQMETTEYDDHGKLECNAAIQHEPNTVDKCVMVKPCTKSVETMTHRIQLKPRRIIPTEGLEFPSSTTTSVASTPTLYTPSTCSTSEEDRKERDLGGRDHIMKIIENDPKSYLGLPKQFLWMIDFLAKECKINRLHIIITLFKIKQNDSMHRIADHFCVSIKSIYNIFQNTVPILASFLQNFIYLPDAMNIKQTLPPVFKPRFACVKCIIDCFEIEIQKPGNSVKQAQTWSYYKSCNTVKYLIACCPNGFICLVSKGFGGRISDKMLTEHSKLIDELPADSVILADRGFKNLEGILRDKNIKILRPPSVSASEKPSKKQVIESKVIASLRVHIERVIRRVREFNLLKPHSVINHNHIYYMDECVIIACALANLQGDIIKQA